MCHFYEEKKSARKLFLVHDQISFPPPTYVEHTDQGNAYTNTPFHFIHCKYYRFDADAVHHYKYYGPFSANENFVAILT